MIKDLIYGEILPQLQKPSRYLGTELNSVHKDPATVDLRVALAFPDLYDLGLGNLGLHILYSILNRLPWCWAERAYAPAGDLETALRARNLPLFALESKSPLAAFDLLGFSLQSELTYTNVLNMLDLGGVTLRSAGRGEDAPLVFAGGPAAVNPEPMAPFIDFFVIGDGEEPICEIAGIVRDMKGRPRRDKLERLAQIPCVYVPALCPVDTLDDGSLIPRAANPIQRCVLKDMDLARFPVDYIVPYTQLVHDRVGLEIMRGCAHGCRFCQAGMIGRPVRARSVERLSQLLDETIAKTGYEEVSLVSLSTCDYPHIRALLSQAAQRARRDDIAVSVPSLRLDTFSVELADAITGVRRSGLTFAPEAATPRLRSLINKWYEDDDLLHVAEEVYRRGWDHVKLYFMIGIPTETDEDVEAIADLCLRVLDRGRQVTRRAKVFTGISTLVPKPFTPFQWAPQIPMEEIRRKQALLARAFGRNPGIKFGRHEPESTYVEGLLARGDRRAADLIETAFRNGARMESSSECLRLDLWEDAVRQTGYDAAARFAGGSQDAAMPLPWDHIDVGVSKAWLWAEWEKAYAGELTGDCRTGGCRMCGVREENAAACAAMLAAAHQEDTAQLPTPLTATAQQPSAQQPSAQQPTEEKVEPPPAQRLRFHIGRAGEARFLSHLEFANAWIRVLHRADAPLSFTQGFHAHPKVTFATAMPLGEESEAEYMDILLRTPVDPQELLAAVRKTLPPGFRAYGAAETPLRGMSLMQAVSGYDYMMTAPGDADEITARAAGAMAAPELAVERKGRPEGRRKSRQMRQVDIRPMLTDLTVIPAETGGVLIRFSTRAVEGKLVKPKEILAMLGIDPTKARVVKINTILEHP